MHSKPPPPQRVVKSCYTKKETAAILRCSEATLGREMARKAIEYIKPNGPRGRTLFRSGAIEVYLQRGTYRAVGENQS